MDEIGFDDLDRKFTRSLLIRAYRGDVEFLGGLAKLELEDMVIAACAIFRHINTCTNGKVDKLMVDIEELDGAGR